MKQQILITEGEHKVGKTSGKPYMRFKTALGWMSAFEKALCEELEKHINTGIPIFVEMTEKDNYKNINNYYGISEGEEATPLPSENKTFAKAPSPTISTGNKNQTMYTSYAKDIFCELHDKDSNLSNEKVMLEAVALVNIAKEFFK